MCNSFIANKFISNVEWRTCSSLTLDTEIAQSCGESGPEVWVISFISQLGAHDFDPVQAPAGKVPNRSFSTCMWQITKNSSFIIIIYIYVYLVVYEVMVLHHFLWSNR